MVRGATAPSKPYSRVSRLPPISAPGRATRAPTQPRKHLRHRQRPALNAVLVRLWRNHEQQDGPRIYLTNGAVDDPWSIINLYDDRSSIENGLFRNSKQFFTLTRWFPKRSAAGVRSHLPFVMLMLGHHHRLSSVGQGPSRCSGGRHRRGQDNQDRYPPHRQPPDRRNPARFSLPGTPGRPSRRSTPAPTSPQAAGTSCAGVGCTAAWRSQPALFASPA